jgi:VPDSG-CTERM motif
MKNRIPLFFSAVCAVLLTFGVSAKALTFGDGNDLGIVMFGIPSGDADRTSYVNHLIDMAPGTSDSFSGQSFQRSSNNPGPGFPNYPTAVFSHNGTPGDNSVDLGDGTLYSYLFAKYDGKNAGSEVWYVGGLSGVITIPQDGLAADVAAEHGYGLSGWTLFGPGGNTNTPDAGTTAALLGLGLSGLAALRAKFGRN